MQVIFNHEYLHVIPPSLNFSQPLIYFNGINTLNVLPVPGLLSTSILPVCSSIILCVIVRPSPVPVFFVVKKGSNINGRSSSAIPSPVSFFSNTAALFLNDVFTTLLHV